MKSWDRRDYDPTALVEEFVEPGRAVLFVGAPGSGKSTLVTKMADMLDERGQPLTAICADPGSPVFGPPGAVSTARRVEGTWHLEHLEALATLDAGTFRLPVATAVRRLFRRVPTGEAAVFVDAPGVHRGRAATELLTALVEAVGASLVIAMGAPDERLAVLDDLAALGVDIVEVPSPPQAKSARSTKRARARSARWDAYLSGATELRLRASLPITGDPPSLDDVPAWLGRQVGLLSARGETLALAEVRKYNGVDFVLSAPAVPVDAIVAMVARDAYRNEKGRLRTDSRSRRHSHEASPEGDRRVRLQTPFERRKRPTIAVDAGGAMSARINFAEVTVVGGLFEDPSLYARFRHDRRGLLFDLGEVARIPPRLIHRVSDIFVSHAHFDHFAGFVDFVRRWVHRDQVCRMWGPPGLADQVYSMVRAFTWDRIEAGDGPVFEVGEFEDGRIRKTRIEAALGQREDLGSEPADDGIIVSEPRFRVRCAALEHGTTSLAYALEETGQFAVRSDRLEGRYTPGKWLGELKHKAAAGDLDEQVELVDGTFETVKALADRLLIEKPGEKIVYATDFADTAENRRRVVALARSAKVLICESTFRRDDAKLADHSRHLTTTACAEIACEADVERLVPFHFSSRYETAPEQLYAEILEIFADVMVPAEIARRLR